MTPSSDPERQWHFSEGSEWHGPCTWEELLQKVERGELHPEHYVCWGDGKEVQPAFEIEGLFGDEPKTVLPGKTTQPDGSKEPTSSELGLGNTMTFPDDFPTIPNYHILRRLGHGGMGIVYKALHIGFNRFDALKLLKSDKAITELQKKRFFREGRALARLDHPNIIRVYDVGEHEGQPYIAMELMSDVLEQALAKERWAFDRTSQLVEKLARAVHAAHQAGIIHRDLKPANVLLDENGEPKLTDFGIARDFQQTTAHTEQGTFLGTVYYMSPEQIRGENQEIDASTDVYSLGVMLYQMLTGQMPFEGPIATVIHHALSIQPVPPRKVNPSIPQELERICLRCLNKEKSNRYLSAEDLANDLKRYGTHNASVTIPEEHGSSRPSRRRAMILITMIAVIGLVALFLSNGAPPPKVSTLDWSRAKPDKPFRDHKGSVRSVAFSPDGKYIASGSDDKTVHVREAATGKLFRILDEHKGEVNSVAFSPDSTKIVSGSFDNSIIIWDLRTGKKVRSIDRHARAVTAVAFSPDGKMVVSATSDAHIKLWEISTGKELHRYEGHTDCVSSIAFSPDGTLLVSGSWDNTAKIWEVETAKELHNLQAHPDQIQSVAFSPDGKQVLTGSSDTMLKLWDAKSGKPLRTYSGHKDWVSSVAFGPKGKYIVSGSYDQTIKIWDCTTPDKVLTLEDHDRVLSVRFSPDGQRMVAGSRDGRVRVWNAMPK